jgi:ADP-ribose pyrophosphatase YjhB (NUDIX family)
MTTPDGANRLKTTPPGPQGAPSREYPTRPFVGVGIVLFRDDQVLLVKRAKPPVSDNWSIPGGAQELGETVRETALRELKEETGVDAELIGLVDVVDGITRDDSGGVKYHYTLVDFAAEWRAGEAAADDDLAAVQWVKVAELDRYKMWDKTARVIRAAHALRPRR